MSWVAFSDFFFTFLLFVFNPKLFKFVFDCGEIYVAVYKKKKMGILPPAAVAYHETERDFVNTDG